ncbi:DUF6735 family protein [Halomicrobium urmianum]|uniref:DUF6735 family protein n=1 Tax=Halomicrobium urmianum TaxID=1586233 RepID=UPI001CDA419C|nr:DUF6735 family protein [Halomicrobium urmianum]
MAHRALVAYRRLPDAYALHYAHWGTGLADAIGPDAPFGGVRELADPARGVAERLGLDASGGYDPPPTRVDPRPLRRRATPEAVLSAVDPSVESLVVVDRDYRAQTYVVCPVGFGPADAPGDPGIVLAHPDGDPAALRELVVETRSALDAAVARVALTPDAARAAFRRALAARATVYPADDASFLRAD